MLFFLFHDFQNSRFIRNTVQYFHKKYLGAKSHRSTCFKFHYSNNHIGSKSRINSFFCTKNIKYIKYKRKNNKKKDEQILPLLHVLFFSFKNVQTSITFSLLIVCNEQIDEVVEHLFWWHLNSTKSPLCKKFLNYHRISFKNITFADPEKVGSGLVISNPDLTHNYLDRGL